MFSCNQLFELKKIGMILLSNQPTNQPTQLGEEKKRKVLNLQPVAVATLCSSFFFGKKWPTAKMLQIHAHDYTTKLRIQKNNTPRNRIRIIGWVRSQGLGSHLTRNQPKEPGNPYATRGTGNAEKIIIFPKKNCHAKRVGGYML